MPMMSAEEISAVARAAGFSPDQAQTMTAIALAESGGDSTHHGTGGDSRGLWQINVRAHPQLAERYDLDDPLDNARAAYELSRSGTDFSPWTVTQASSRVTSEARAAAVDRSWVDRHRFLLGSALALAAALVLGLWIGSTVGEPSETPTQAMTTPVATPSMVAPTAPAVVPPPVPTPTVTEIPATPEPTQTPAEAPAETAVETPQGAAVGPAQPPDIVAVRATPISPDGCDQAWTAQVVVVATGDVDAVTAVWTPAAGGDMTEVALSSADPAWTGQLADLPPGEEVQLTVRAEGSGGTVESDGQTLAPPCPVDEST